MAPPKAKKGSKKAGKKAGKKAAGKTTRRKNPPKPKTRRRQRRKNPPSPLSTIVAVAGGAALLGAATAAVREATASTGPMDAGLAMGIPAIASVVGSKMSGSLGAAMLYGGAALVGVALAERLGSALRARGVLAAAPTTTAGRLRNAPLRLAPPLMRDQLDMRQAADALA